MREFVIPISEHEYYKNFINRNHKIKLNQSQVRDMFSKAFYFGLWHKIGTYIEGDHLQ